MRYLPLLLLLAVGCHTQAAPLPPQCPEIVYVDRVVEVVREVEVVKEVEKIVYVEKEPPLSVDDWNPPSPKVPLPPPVVAKKGPCSKLCTCGCQVTGECQCHRLSATPTAVAAPSGGGCANGQCPNRR